MIKDISISLEWGVEVRLCQGLRVMIRQSISRCIFLLLNLCFVNCLQAGRELQTSASVPKYLVRSHVYWPGAALMPPSMPSETVGCCLVVLNNKQIFASFFLFSLLLLKLPPLKTVTPAFPPHTPSVILSLILLPGSLCFGWGLIIRICLLAFLLCFFQDGQWPITSGKYKYYGNILHNSGGKIITLNVNSCS